MSIKEAYYYLFYKLYEFSEGAPSRWLSDWKAGVVIIVLEIWLITSFLIYYKVFLNPKADIIGSEISWILLLLILIMIDYFIFHRRDRWKDIVMEFDHLPKRTNRIGGWIVFGVVVVVLANLLLAFYLYYQL